MIISHYVCAFGTLALFKVGTEKYMAHCAAVLSLHHACWEPRSLANSDSGILCTLGYAWDVVPTALIAACPGPSAHPSETLPLPGCQLLALGAG